MPQYEIRVFSAGHTIAIAEEMHVSDHAAVRSGVILAGGKLFEVRRGEECIYEPPKWARDIHGSTRRVVSGDIGPRAPAWFERRGERR